MSRNEKIIINISQEVWKALTLKALSFAHKDQIMRLLISGFAGLLLSFPLYAQDQYLLVSNREGRDILRYDAETGAFVDVLVKAGSGNMNVPMGMALGPDGNLYVSSHHTEIFPRNDPRVLKFDS